MENIIYELNKLNYDISNNDELKRYQPYLNAAIEILKTVKDITKDFKEDK